MIGDWLRENSDQITTGVIASVIVLALQVVVLTVAAFLYDVMLRKHPAKRIWGMRSPKKIFLVSGSIEALTGPTGLAYLAAPDAEAVAVTGVALRLLYPKADIVHMYAPGFSPDLYRADVVAIGGPVNNVCTRTLMQALQAPAHFDGLDLVTEAARYELAPGTTQDPITTDYGLILSAPNPFSPEHRSVVIAGCDTHGVLAAANAMTPERRNAAFRGAVGRSHGVHRWWAKYSYCAVVEARALANTVGDPKTREAVRLSKTPKPAVLK